MAADEGKWGAGLRAMADLATPMAVRVAATLRIADHSFVQLLHTVRTGEPAFRAQFDRSFWEDLSSDGTLSPGAVDVAGKMLKAAGFADRTDVVAGSFFDPLPPGAGGYLLSAIIHDWDDEAALHLAALRGSGRCGRRSIRCRADRRRR